MDDVAKAAKSRREADDAVVEMLLNENNDTAERAKLILTVLHAAAVPLDLLTASILHDLGCKMGAVIQTEDEE